MATSNPANRPGGASVASRASAEDADGGASSLSHLDLHALEAKLDRLLATCAQLREENRALKNQQANLITERAQLIERSELARSRVEAMIARLKAMESGS